MASLLNCYVEWEGILNDITHDNNKVLGDKSNKTVKFHITEMRREEAVYKFKSVVEAEKRNGGSHKK